MKKTLLSVSIVVALAFMTNLTMAQTFSYPVNGKPGFNLNEKTRDGLHISYNLGQMSLNSLNYRGEDMTEISISAITCQWRAA